MLNIFDDTLFRPWLHNPLKTRDDVMRALQVLVEPVEKYRSRGGARIRLGPTAAHFDEPSADLEGFSRLLWGLAPAQVGGADWIDWSPISRGLANGCDPEHQEYWGKPFDHSQRLVELAAIAFALRIVTDKLWSPLSAKEKANVAQYLVEGYACTYVPNNWKFFRLMIGMALRHLGIDHDGALGDAYVTELDEFYLGDGWYQDGDARRADHYVPFAFHFYGLILAALDNGNWTKRYRERASLIAPDIARWFADEGPAICFGRSMTYRFAIAGFFGATALAGDATIPWDQQKGAYLRNLRWWAKQPFASRDGILSVGYGYDNLMMSEPYNSPQSPYWALKAFLPLMLPDEHPFWASDETCAPRADTVSVQKHAGLVVANLPSDAVALSSGQQTAASNSAVRFGAEKYAKFAYSARYGFSIESDACRFRNAVFDSMIGFSEDGLHFGVREKNEEVLVTADGLLFARWQPFADVSVDTFLYWDAPFHVRVHQIETPRRLETIEGGFAIPCLDDKSEELVGGKVVVVSGGDLSAVFDLTQHGGRTGRSHVAPPNTNLIAPKTLVPQLLGEVLPGKATLITAVVAGAQGCLDAAIIQKPPSTPQVDELYHRINRDGMPVSLMRGFAG